MHAIPGKSIQKYRQSRDKSFSFTCRHFGNFALVQNDTAEQLDIIMNHVPCHLIASGYPVILIDGFISFDMYKIMSQCQFPVKRCSSHGDRFILSKTTGSIFYYRKYLGQYLIKNFLIFFKNRFLDLVYFFPNGFTFFVILFFYRSS